MKTLTVRAGLKLAASLSVLLCTGVASAAPFADLTDWVGLNNTSPANNYTVTSQTSAGGTFAERKLNESALSDQTLAGGPFNYASVLSISGNMTFSGSVDPVLFFGWYNSGNLNERIGLGLANPVPVGGGERIQVQNGNVAGSGVVSANIGTTTTNSTLPAGTYAFTFDYDGAGHMNGTIGSLTFVQRNYAQPTNTNLNLNRFGFLQKSTADDNVNTITMSVSNINYTGQTLTPEPASLGLVAGGGLLALRRRRRA